MDNLVLIPIPITDLRAIIAEEVQGVLLQWKPSPAQPEQSSASGTDTMTRAEVLVALRCTSPTLRSLERQNELRPCTRIGRKPLWLRRDVEQFLRGSGKKP